MISIPIPVHPDDKDLPLSAVNIKLPSGKLAGFVLPIQGKKTIDNAIATLGIWRYTLVQPAAPNLPATPVGGHIGDAPNAGANLSSPNVAVRHAEDGAKHAP